MTANGSGIAEGRMKKNIFVFRECGLRPKETAAFGNSMVAAALGYESRFPEFPEPVGPPSNTKECEARNMIGLRPLAPEDKETDSNFCIYFFSCGALYLTLNFMKWN